MFVYVGINLKLPEQSNYKLFYRILGHCQLDTSNFRHHSYVDSKESILLNQAAAGCGSPLPENKINENW